MVGREANPRGGPDLATFVMIGTRSGVNTVSSTIAPPLGVKVNVRSVEVVEPVYCSVPPSKTNEPATFGDVPNAFGV